MSEPSPPAHAEHEDEAQAAGEARAEPQLDRGEWRASELAKLRLDGFPGTRRGFQIWLQERGVRCERRRVRGGDALVFRTPDLPRELQLAILQHEVTAWGQGAGAADAPAVDLESACRAHRELSALPDAAQRRADARAAAVTTYEHWCRELGRKPSTRLADLFAEAWARGEIAVPDGIRAALPTFCGRILRTWRGRMMKEGAVALAGRYTKPQPMIDKVPGMRDRALALIQLRPDLPATHLRDGLAVKFGDATPSADACRAWLNKWKRQNKSLHAHLVNPDAHKAKFMPAFGDASEAVTRLNQLWELDDTKADVILSDGKRYTVLGCIDVFSRRLMLHIHPTASSEGLAQLLRRALLTWGVPEMMRTDRGSNYKSHRTVGLLTDLAIRHDLLQAYKPERKGFIEKALGDFSRSLLPWLSNFVGHNVAHRQAIEAQKSFAERKAKRIGDHPEKDADPVGLTFAEFRDICDKWCAARNAKKHGSLNMSPDMKAASYPGTVRRISDERALDVLLMPIAGTRTVSKKGIRVNGGCYFAQELGDWIGETVTCREDPSDAGYLYVYSAERKFICRAFDPELAGVSRAEIARAARSIHQGKVRSGRDRLRKAAGKSGLDQKTIARDILTARIAASPGVVPFPRPGVTHASVGLDEAGRAASADDVPKAPSRTEADAQREAHLRALVAKREAEEAQSPEAREKQFLAEMLGIFDALSAGDPVPADRRDWFALCARHHTFRTALHFKRGVAFDQITKVLTGLLGVSSRTASGG